jgi:polar amino acid transport system substrate-binding protein
MNLSSAYRATDSQHGFVVKADTVDAFTSLESFTGKRIGFQKGTLQEMYATAQIKDLQAQPFDSVQNAILALQSGKVEAVAVSYDNGELFCDANDDLSMAEPLFEGTKDQTVVACPKDADALMAEVNAAIAEVNEQELYAQWWDDATASAKELGVSQ